MTGNDGECCGRVRRSNFCPECGKTIQGVGPLSGLLRHCRVTASSYRKREKEIDSRLRQIPDQTPELVARCIKKRDQVRANAEKWEQYASVLKKVCEGEG